MMEDILKAIAELKSELSRRIDLLEAHQYKGSTLLLKDVHKIVTSKNAHE
jgi:hypothetical protein